MFCALALFLIFTLLSEVGKEKACKDKELPAKFWKTAFSFGPWPLPPVEKKKRKAVGILCRNKEPVTGT